MFSVDKKSRHDLFEDDATSEAAWRNGVVVIAQQTAPYIDDRHGSIVEQDVDAAEFANGELDNAPAITHGAELGRLK